MKTTFLFLSLLVSQVGFAADKIICADGGKLVTFEVAKLADFGLLPTGLTPELETMVTNSVCDFQGVFQESWGATCFDKDAVSKLVSGGFVPNLSMSGYEHGSLTATDIKRMDCQGY